MEIDLKEEIRKRDELLVGVSDFMGCHQIAHIN